MAFPASPALGDTHDESGVTYIFNGVTWTEGWAVSVAGVDIVADNVAPTSAAVGTQWLDLTTNQLKQYDGSNWNLIRSI